MYYNDAHLSYALFHDAHQAMFVQLGSGPDAEPNSWRLYKLGRPISPLDVVVNGSKSLHAVSDEGVHVDSIAADGGDCGQRLVVRCVCIRA